MKISPDISLIDFLDNLIEAALTDALTAERYPTWKRTIPEGGLTDVVFLRMCIIQAFSLASSGLAFLQQWEEKYEQNLASSTYHDAITSKRRMEMVMAAFPFIHRRLCKGLADLSVDYLATFPELDGYAVTAADGHFVKGKLHAQTANAARDKNRLMQEDEESRRKKPRTSAAFVYAQNLRNGLKVPAEVITDGSINGSELKTFKNWLEKIKPESFGARYHIIVYDSLFAGYEWWEQRRLEGTFFVSKPKSNENAEKLENVDFDEEDSRNSGVITQVKFTKKIKRKKYQIRLVRFLNAADGKEHSFITNLPFDIPPGVVAELYRRRWNIEKDYDTQKNDMAEQEAWSTLLNGVRTQSFSVAIACNLARFFHEQNIAEHPDLIHKDQLRYEKRLEEKELELKSKNRKLSPLLWLPRIMRMPCAVIRSFRNRLESKGLVSDLRRSLRKHLRIQPGYT